MDPNATLENIRDALKAMGDPDGDASWYKDNARHIDTLIENVSTLDNWVSNGGALPKEWNTVTRYSNEYQAELERNRKLL
jgi:hypothetical protein